MISEKTWAFIAGAAVGAGAVCFIRSQAGHKAAVALTEKGMELKNRVLETAERVREAASDIAAEARYSMEQKENNLSMANA